MAAIGRPGRMRSSEEMESQGSDMQEAVFAHGQSMIRYGTPWQPEADNQNLVRIRQAQALAMRKAEIERYQGAKAYDTGDKKGSKKQYAFASGDDNEAEVYERAVREDFAAHRAGGYVPEMYPQASMGIPDSDTAPAHNRVPDLVTFTTPEKNEAVIRDIKTQDLTESMSQLTDFAQSVGQARRFGLPGKPVDARVGRFEIDFRSNSADLKEDTMEHLEKLAAMTPEDRPMRVRTHSMVDFTTVQELRQRRGQG